MPFVLLIETAYCLVYMLNLQDALEAQLKVKFGIVVDLAVIELLISLRQPGMVVRIYDEGADQDVNFAIPPDHKRYGTHTPYFNYAPFTCIIKSWFDKEKCC